MNVGIFFGRCMSYLRSVVLVDAEGGVEPHQNLSVDLLLVHVERPRLKPVTDVFACVHDDGLTEQGRIGSEQSGEVVNAAADCHPTVGHGVVCSHLRCGEPPAITQHLPLVCANQVNFLDAH
jgi:hypothetical protein